MRPLPDSSRASALKTSPTFDAATKFIVQASATVFLLRELQARANVVSASVKVTPPWQIPSPFTMSLRTTIVVTATPGLILSSSIAKCRLTLSSCNILAATSCASLVGLELSVARSSVNAITLMWDDVRFTR